MDESIHTDKKLLDALRSIITGDVVKRSKHELLYDDKDLTPTFIGQLKLEGYLPSTVGQINVEPGERVPAFIIKEKIAYFGWVFWEQFTSWKMRKLWGSILKNKRGDWSIQISEHQQTTIYANESLKSEMDIDHPPEF